MDGWMDGRNRWMDRRTDCDHLVIPLLFKVVFKNKASRPYSFHLQGVYDHSQGSSLTQTHVSSAPPGVPGEPVAPGEARTYSWRITKTQGPTDSEFSCKTGAYYSTVDKVCIWSFVLLTVWNCTSLVLCSNLIEQKIFTSF